MWWPVRNLPRQADERHHYRQVATFCAGDTTVGPKLAMLPVYHAVTAAVAAPLGRCDDMAFLRLVNVAFGAAGVVLFHLARRARHGDDPLRTLQFALLPVLAAHHAQVYTDTLATTAVLGAMALAASGRMRAATAAASAGILVRPTNAAWLAFLLLDELERRWRATGTWRARLEEWVRAVWPGLAVAALYAVIAVSRGGLVFKENRAHPLGIHLGNLWLYLALAGALLLPHTLRALRAAPRAGWAVAIVAAAAFAATFTVMHPYNRFEGFLRNDVLAQVEAEPWARGAAAVAVAAGVVLLARWRREIPLAYWPPLALTLLLPSLIEHRYLALPLTLLLLWLPRDRPVVEAAAAAWSALLTGALVAGIARGAFLL